LNQRDGFSLLRVDPIGRMMPMLDSRMITTTW
jgi:hypothetical protein